MRTILLGLHNPHSDDPAAALGLDPPNASGARLFRMLQEAAQRENHVVTEEDYLTGFERINLLKRLDMSGNEIKARRTALMSYLRKRVVVMLGTQVPAKLELPSTFFEVLHSKTMEFTYYVLPHPSGANRLYNDADVRKEAGDLLLRLWKDGQACRSPQAVHRQPEDADVRHPRA